MAKKNPWDSLKYPMNTRAGMRQNALRFYKPAAIKKPVAPGPNTNTPNSNAPTNPAAPSGGGGGNPYAGILSEFLNSSKARFAADSAADAASRDAALRRYVISYGQVPDFDKLGISDQTRGFLQGALDPKTKALAEQNTKEGTSVFARTAKANEVANRRIPAQLAARGMLRSGQTGSDLGDQAQSYKIQSFDQLNEMLGGMEGTVGNFLQAERARADALAEAELQAQMNAAGEYGGDMTPEEPGGPDTSTPGGSKTPWLDRRQAQLKAQRAAAAARQLRMRNAMRLNEQRRARAGRAT